MTSLPLVEANKIIFNIPVPYRMKKLPCFLPTCWTQNDQILHWDPLRISSFPSLKYDQNLCLAVLVQVAAPVHLELH